MRTSFELAPRRDTLLDEWRRLYAQSDARFFLSPVWIESWLDAIPAGVEVGVLRVFDDLRGVYGICLVGVPDRLNFAAPREARIHETGDESLDRTYVEYNDLLLARDAPAGAREAAVAGLLDALPSVDEFVFRNAREPLASAIEAVAEEHGLSTRSLKRQPTFRIALNGLEDKSVVDVMSSSLRAKIRRSLRLYEERGPVELHSAVTDAERAIAWTELMRLHAETWSRRGQEGAFRDRTFTGFHERLIRAFPQSIDLLRLTVGGEAIGVLYNFVDGDIVCNYQSGFRYEADNRMTPGFVTHALAAERYRQSGFSAYDMMAGDADYKRRLGEEGERLETIALLRPTLRVRLRDAVRRITIVPDAKTHRT